MQVASMRPPIKPLNYGRNQTNGAHREYEQESV